MRKIFKSLAIFFTLLILLFIPLTADTAKAESKKSIFVEINLDKNYNPAKTSYNYQDYYYELVPNQSISTLKIYKKQDSKKNLLKTFNNILSGIVIYEDKLFFVSYTDNNMKNYKNPSINQSDLNGENLKAATTINGENMFPYIRFAFDNNIYYSYTTDDMKSKLVKMNLNTYETKTIINDCGNIELLENNFFYMPLMYDVSPNDLNMVSIDGGKPKKISKNVISMFVHDNKLFYYYIIRYKAENDVTGQLYSVDKDGNNKKKIGKKINAIQVYKIDDKINVTKFDKDFKPMLYVLDISSGKLTKAKK